MKHEKTMEKNSDHKQLSQMTS